MSETSVDVVKWYTRARKFPQLIGKTPDGKRLWGGPYTITQALGFVLVLFVGTKTMGLWGTHGFIGNLLLLGSVAFGVVYGLGKIPFGSRNPLSITAGVFKAVASPQHGRLAGRPVRLRRPHRVRHTMVVGLPALAGDPSATSSSVAAAQPASARTAPDRRSRRRRLPALVHRTNRPAPAGPPATAPALPASSPPTAAPAPAPAPAPALTGIQELLASAAAGAAPTHRSENTR